MLDLITALISAAVVGGAEVVVVDERRQSRREALREKQKSDRRFDVRNELFRIRSRIILVKSEERDAHDAWFNTPATLWDICQLRFKRLQEVRERRWALEREEEKLERELRRLSY